MNGAVSNLENDQGVKNPWKNKEHVMPELSPEFLVKSTNDSFFDFDTTESVEPLKGVIGQQRAVRSLDFGLNMQEKGFNIYVAGPPGTGRLTAVTSFLRQHAASTQPPSDWCYVHNFRDALSPNALELPQGMGIQFQKAMAIFVSEARRDILRAFQSQQYSEHREQLLQDLQQDRETLYQRMSDRAENEGFLLGNTPSGLVLTAQKNGVAIDTEAIEALPEAERLVLQSSQQNLQVELQRLLLESRNAERAAQENALNLDQRVARATLDFLVAELIGKYSTASGLTAYLNDVTADMLENMDLFKPVIQSSEGTGSQAGNLDPIDGWRRYDVNVVVDNTFILGAPVVMEPHPTLRNLLGRVEREAYMGSLRTDFTMIQPGSLHKANGGFLILRIEDILHDPSAWEGLKRCLKEEKILLDMTADVGIVGVKSINPSPISLDIKVILIGNTALYHMLYSNDPDFLELFKVKSEFDLSMEKSEVNLTDYASFVAMVCTKEKLRHMSRDGVVRLTEHSSRMAENQSKLSTSFAEITDIIRESNHWASVDRLQYIGLDHVEKTIAEKIYRSGLIQDKMAEMVESGLVVIDTHGKVVGQINGLAVINVGDSHFGRPSRITASVGIGREGIIDVERESALGGRLHTKGVMILGGYLTDKFASSFPLSLVGHIAFEQSYQEVDGDSASSAELYTILSCLSDLPINQGIAVTGSVNQKGEIQANGGVNDKIEGFFGVCKTQGLTGSQGVMIPQSNVQHLMLRPEIIEAVRDGKFHLYSVHTVDEGIALLTGVEAGDRQADGSFPPESVNYRVLERLQGMAYSLRDFIKPGI